jgi:CheY-like chemotaxis protein
VDLSRLGDEERAAFNAGLARTDARASVSRELWAAGVAAFFDAAGAPPRRPRQPEGPPALVVDVGGPGWAEHRWDAEGHALFVPCAHPLPEGDELELRLRTAAGSLFCRARVSSSRCEARPGLPAGFTLALREPPAELVALLDARATGEASEAERRRAHPRYPVRAPAMVAAAGDSTGGDLVGADGRPRYLIEDISEGGAFIRTAEPHPVGARLAVAATLPTGDVLRNAAEVVFRSERGMGVRWLADEAQEQELAEVVARTAARPRRALVVGDDSQERSRFAEALQQKGFEVLTAPDGVAALQLISEEVLSLDLLLADVWLPKMDGETLLRTVRQAGGESDLAIVLVAGRTEPGQESRLERAGADAVLRKELGPHVLAQAAAAALERKRKRGA